MSGENALKHDMKEDAQTKSVNDMWNKFKHSLHESIKRHIPSKVLGNRRNIPWMTKSIKRKINRKRRLYKKSKRSNSPRVQKQFRKLRKEIQNELKHEHNKYIQSLFEDKESDSKEHQHSISKRFWSYIKGRRKDNVAISTLREGNQETNNQEEMANILNRQYESVFTDDSGNLPDKGNSTTPDMPCIKFTAKGIENSYES